MLPAGNQAPLRHDGPDGREVVLADLVVVLDVVGAAGGAEVRVGSIQARNRVITGDVVAVAITHIDDLVGIVSRLVMEHGAARASAVSIRVPVEGRMKAPVLIE